MYLVGYPVSVKDSSPSVLTRLYVKDYKVVVVGFRMLTSRLVLFGICFFLQRNFVFLRPLDPMDIVVPSLEEHKRRRSLMWLGRCTI